MPDNESQDDVSAELDRRAFGPAEPGAADMPRLAPAPQDNAPRRPPVPPRVTPPAAVYGGSPGWKRRRRRTRRFLSLLITLGLAGGGLYVARQYLLDKVVWDRDVAERAAAVEAAMGLAFTDDVPVVEVSFGEYASASAARLVGDDADLRRRLGGEWRALGLLTGQSDLTSAAASAAVETPAFYDPSGRRIVIVADLPNALRTFALDRALGSLLVDQHRRWSEDLGDHPWAAAIGTQALAEAIALEAARSLLGPNDATVILEQMLNLAVEVGAPPSTSPYASVLLGRLGVAAWPVIGWARDRSDWEDGVDGGSWLTEVTAESVVVDAQMLDVTRLLGGRTEAPSDSSRGMLYWYHVLAGRIDDDEAWKAALLWRDDRVTTRESGGALCVSAEFMVPNRDLVIAETAFASWASLAPADSLTVVATEAVSVDVGIVRIDSCDPGATVATTDGSAVLGLGAAPLRAEQFRRIMAADRARLPEAVACQTWGARDVVTLADERGVLDPAEGWAAVDAHGDPTQISLGSC